MPLRAEDLPHEIEPLRAMVLSLAAENEALKAAIKQINAQVFGQRSERASLLAEGQLDLELGDLADAPTVTDQTAPAPTREHAKRKPANRNIGRLASWLPRVIEVIEPAVTTCACCSGALHKIGEDVAEALDAVPAQVRVLRTIRPKYACRACESGITQAPAKLRLFDGGMATTALVASVAVWKYAWHMPLNRQAQILAGQGVRLDRATLGKWVKKAAWWLKGLYLRQLEVIHSHPRLYCDETRLPVRKIGRRRTHTGQLWAHAVDDRTWGGPAAPAVVYIFAQGRGHKEIRAQLADYQGLLQVDGYSAYKGLAKPGRKPGPIELAFCLAHARRKFTDVYKTTQSPFAAEAIGAFARIYAIEAEIRGRSAQERMVVRQAKTAPMMADLKRRFEDELAGLSSKSKLAGAIRYNLAHWSGLTRFLNDGRLEADNNSVERTMRPIALGRRNHLFAGDDGGAETWAILASLLNTARLNDIDPFVWLNDVLEQIVSGQTKANDLDRLLAWNWKADRAVQMAAAA
ncbi:IS66 family transposase [Phenylobacterium sp.]|jgi:transposase|uniref:IS66 family transposase n=1 Tax=Phenylobacterium sp. TaxID=1871053 RepID=UPI002E31D5C3|nr:IS66 family transposase [Phenylobacterium sp.]HEX3363922.1 IS66 family transposase [Phenylobacterium sp.]